MEVSIWVLVFGIIIVFFGGWKLGTYDKKKMNEIRDAQINKIKMDTEAIGVKDGESK